MKKKLVVLVCYFLIAGCRADNVRLDPVATANAPWKKNEMIVSGFCSQDAYGWCLRVFLGITTEGKVLVQDFFAKINDRIESGKIYDPRTTEIESKFTDPFTMLSVDNAKLNLFYVDDGKDGEYRSYYSDGQISKVGHFRNGVKHGRWTVYFHNGTGFKDNYDNGKLISSEDFGMGPVGGK